MKIFPAGLLVLLLIASWSAGGCSRKKAAPVPASPSYLDIGEAYFDRGDYIEAAQAYELHLRQASDDQEDRTLLRLALAYLSTPETEERRERAGEVLQRLVTEYPNSRLVPEGRILLQVTRSLRVLQAEQRELNAELERLEARIAQSQAGPPPDLFEQAESLFQQGNYTVASQMYRSYLSAEPRGEHRAEALFRLAMIQLTDRRGGEQREEAVVLLTRLVQEHPTSPLRQQAELVLGWMRQISEMRENLQVKEQRLQELTKELEALKEIDLRRRSPRS